jgi:eukaryotic-like serine/threonine-protein kinase
MTSSTVWARRPCWAPTVWPKFSWQLKNGFGAVHTLEQLRFLDGGVLDDKQVMHAMSIDDMYRVERVLASGQGGVTELVTVDGTGPFVRKKIPESLANRGVWSALASCDCDRLPRVEATYALPEQFVVVYDFVPGQTLETMVGERGRLPQAEVASLIADICEASAALHAQGVVHRDISPRNVIVGADGAHLIDLGIARLRVEGASRDTTSLGTWGYASPEQYGFAQTDARSDVYSIGRIMGFLLTGVQPDSDGYQELLADGAVVSGVAHAVVERACAFEPSGRYQSAEELSAAVRSLGENRAPEQNAPQVENGASSSVETEAPSANAAPHRGISRRALLAGAGVVVIAGAGAYIASKLTSDEDAGLVAGAAATTAISDKTSTTDSTANSTSGGTVSLTDDGEALELAESGWSVDSVGYVHYAYAIKNPNEDIVVDLPSVDITGYDKEGNVVLSQNDGIMTALPDSTSYYGAQAGSGGLAVPTRVEFNLGENSTTSRRRVTESFDISTSGLAVNKNSLGQTVFTGTVSVAGTSDVIERAARYSSGIAVTVVLRDSVGAIIYGESTHLYTLAAGTYPFEVRISDAPTYATAEAHAIPW